MKWWKDLSDDLWGFIIIKFYNKLNSRVSEVIQYVPKLGGDDKIS